MSRPNKNPARDNLSETTARNSPELLLGEGVDYYLENGLYVFTASYLLRRGFCCDNNCRHCPYPKESKE